jgi:hypothetical protein
LKILKKRWSKRCVSTGRNGIRGTPDQALLMNSMSKTFNTRLESQHYSLATSKLQVNIGRLQLDDVRKP